MDSKCFYCGKNDGLHKTSTNCGDFYVCEEHTPFVALYASAINSGHGVEDIIKFYKDFCFMMDENIAEFDETIGTEEEVDCDIPNRRTFIKMYEIVASNPMIMSALLEAYLSE